MCGLMPSDAGYDLTLYPNLGRYRTPQKDINDNNPTYNPTPDSMYDNKNNNNNNNAHQYKPYRASHDNLSIPAYKPKAQTNPLSQVEEEEKEEDEFDFPVFTPRHQTTTTNSPSTLPVAKHPAHSTIFVRIFASDILMWGDEWRRCPVCLSNKVCLLRGRCVEDGRRVKILFW